MTEEEINRLWSKVDIKNKDECWNWKASLSNGYGQIGFNKKVYRAFRLIYTLTYGEIPEGLIICHKCNNKKCCNPDHLYAGTYKDNSHDAKLAGVLGKGNHDNAPKGEDNPFSKLKEADILEIRKQIQLGTRSLNSIAKDFNTTRQNISLIKLGKAWKHIK